MQNHPKIDWSEFLCTDEELQDFQVVTLKSVIEDRCYDLALQRIPFPRGPIPNVEAEARWVNDVETLARELYENHDIKPRDVVDVDEDYNARVIINAPEITDKEIDRALILLEIAAKAGRVPGITYFDKGDIIKC